MKLKEAYEQANDGDEILSDVIEYGFIKGAKPERCLPPSLAVKHESFYVKTQKKEPITAEGWARSYYNERCAFSIQLLPQDLEVAYKAGQVNAMETTCSTDSDEHYKRIVEHAKTVSFHSSRNDCAADQRDVMTDKLERLVNLILGGK